MVRDRGHPAHQRAGIVRHSKLAHDRPDVEVHALADEAVLLEQEERRHPAFERAARRGQPAEAALMGPTKPELGDHGVVGVMQGDQLVALVGEGRAALSVIRPYLGLSVVHVVRADQLVARVVERLYRHVEFEPVLRLHVLAHYALALLAESVSDRHRLPQNPAPSAVTTTSERPAPARARRPTAAPAVPAPSAASEPFSAPAPGRRRPGLPTRRRSPRRRHRPPPPRPGPTLRPARRPSARRRATAPRPPRASPSARGGRRGLRRDAARLAGSRIRSRRRDPRPAGPWPARG